MSKSTDKKEQNPIVSLQEKAEQGDAGAQYNNNSHL